MTPAPSPPWGQSPLDIYLLEKWDVQSAKTPEEQRTALVRDYVQLGWRARRRYDDLVESKHAAIPTSEQIQTVLEPWRSVKQRWLAHNLGDPAAVWLRTCYDGESEEAHETLIKAFDIEYAIGAQGKLLNASELYDFKENWSKIFEVLPELVDPGTRAPTTRKELRRIKEDIDVGNLPGAVMEAIRITQQLYANDPVKLAERSFKITHAPVQLAAVTNYLVIEDAEALRTGLVMFVFIDECGRVVRQARAKDSLSFMIGQWMDGCWDDQDPWESADVGQDYSEGEVCGPPYISHTSTNELV